MESAAIQQGPKRVRLIAPAIVEQKDKKEIRQQRVAAYCRVSTKQEEQLNSYEVQKRYYLEKINGNPDWKLAGIYADKGITGTSVKKREKFNLLIQHCKRGKIDMIIVKSISRFARNTLDCLKYTRMLKDLNVDVFFEEQGIHSIQPGAEFYITIYGSIAQSESENISANIRWGKAQSAKEGKASFFYKNFLGYRKGDDGLPKIDEEQAATVRFIYERFLAGDSMWTICKKLEAKGILSPSRRSKWMASTVQSILTNERYKGDVILNKTFVVDCLSKKVKVNNGERPKYYVENNHPAIIDALTFAKVQEELARRTGKRKVKQIGSKTEQGRYSSKYALTDLLICGECKTPYRRCTWTIRGQKKIVWRCINRLDYGKKYCHDSPSVEEGVLHKAIMNAVMETAQQNVDVLKTLKEHIAIGLEIGDNEDMRLELHIRIAEIDAEIKDMINSVSSETVEQFDESKAQALLMEKNELKQQLENEIEERQKREIVQSRLDEIYMILDGLKNHPLTYDDELIRKLLQCVVVESSEQIRVVFVGGIEILEKI